MITDRDRDKQRDTDRESETERERGETRQQWLILCIVNPVTSGPAISSGHGRGSTSVSHGLSWSACLTLVYINTAACCAPLC